MSKVLLVNRLTGEATALDTEGNKITVADGMLSYFEATTAMNRLAEGYIHMSPGNYAIRLDIVSESGSRTENLVITDMVVIDSQGEPQRKRPVDYDTAIYQLGNAINVRYVAMVGKINSENSTITWANNPLEADAFESDIDMVPKVLTGTPMEEMLYLFRRRQNMTLEPVEVLITMYLEQ